MKFSTSLITLLATSFVYSFNLNNVKFAVNVNPEIATAVECKTNIDKMSETCIKRNDEITKDNIKSVCQEFKSTNCQDFFNNGITKLGGCGTLGEQLQMAEPIILSYKLTMSVVCEMDENDNLCPLANQILEGMDVNANKTSIENVKVMDDKTILGTCQSKKCTDSAKKYATESIENYDKLFSMIGVVADLAKANATEIEIAKKEFNNVYQVVIDALNAPNCTSLAKTQSSGALSNTVTLSTIFYVLISLLYNLF